METIRTVVQEVLQQESFDWRSERDRYLSRIGVFYTQRNYRNALARFEAWCNGRGTDPSALSPAEADDWIADERAAGWAAATVNLAVTAASAFYTWLERRHRGLRNPFRGTRERPRAAPVRQLAVPSEHEVQDMIAAAPPVARAIIVCLARTGLRRGGLPRLTVDGGVYRTISKGRLVKGKWPAEVAEAVAAAGLDARQPFAGLQAPNISDRIRRVSRDLHAAGRSAAVYSAHDLRHAFAVAHYRAHRDIYATSKALNHASVGMTAVYLRSLPGIDD